MWINHSARNKALICERWCDRHVIINLNYLIFIPLRNVTHNSTYSHGNSRHNPVLPFMLFMLLTWTQSGIWRRRKTVPEFNYVTHMAVWCRQTCKWAFIQQHISCFIEKPYPVLSVIIIIKLLQTTHSVNRLKLMNKLIFLLVASLTINYI